MRVRKLIGPTEQPKAPEQPTVSIGLITTGTILAVGVSAAYIAIATGQHGQPGFKPDPFFTFAAGASAIISVMAYGFTMVFGLASLSPNTETRRTQELKNTMISLYLQAFSATVFALVAIISFMFVGNGKETEVTQLPHDRAKTHDEILADSRNLQDQAIDLLEKGNVREAAEISWGATKRATDALVLARTGNEPTTRSQTSDKLEALSRQDPRVISLIGRYYSRLSQLHYACFHDGVCKPEDNRRILETSDYIRDAERLSED